MIKWSDLWFPPINLWSVPKRINGTENKMTAMTSELLEDLELVLNDEHLTNWKKLTKIQELVSDYREKRYRLTTRSY
jgi:hypothetical protein